jgi:hypothetical protein
VGEGDWTEVIVFALDRLSVREGAGLVASDGDGAEWGGHRPAAAAAAARCVAVARYDDE